jgi:hypothetical protein
MALKFRRGTTAQQSGSLAFGEPYVNTTLGTLLIGGPDGDIVLSTTGTGSVGNFGPISGSGLDITGNANIAGDLTLGGQLTIGDATSDTVNVVASLSSSLIPSETNAFDLGSASKIWRDLYISTGSIKFVAGTTVVKELSLSTLTSLETATGSSNVSISNLNSFSSSALTRLAALEVETANLESFTSSINTTIKTQLNANTVVSGSSQINYSGISNIPAGIVSGAAQVTPLLPTGTVSGSSQVVGILSSLNSYTASNDTTNTTQNSRLTALEASASTALSTNNTQATSITNLNSFTSSINTTIKSKLDADGVISGSSQVVLSNTNGFSTFSSSVDSRILNEKGRIDAILSASTADADTFAEIVALINSVDLENDQSFAAFYTASNGRLNNLESKSASVDTSVSNINSFSSSALTRLDALEVETANLESFTSSINTTIKTQLNANTVVSGSSQVVGILSSLNSYTASNDTTNTTQNSRLDQLSTASGSAIGRLNNLESFTSSINTTIKTQLNANTVISGSSQVTGITNGQLTNSAITIAGTSTSLGGSITLATITGASGIVSGSAQITPLLPTGTVSGSAQINVASTTGDIALGTRTSGNYVATITAGTGVSTTGAATGEGIAHTISIGQAVGTTSNVQFNSLGVGMAASATAGRIDATNDIVAFSSSDIRFKENIKAIENPIQKIRQISGNTYDWKAENKIEHGYEGNDVGVIAQEIEAVLPQLVQTRESGYKAVKYDKLVALLIEGIKEQQIQIDNLTAQVEELKKQKGL